jgi:long-subunit acyl-CoA synthetase (AMP-forming)
MHCGRASYTCVTQLTAPFDLVALTRMHAHSALSVTHMHTHARAQDVPALCRERAVVQAITHSMVQEGRAAQLRGFEAVAAITLVPEPFTVENGLLTPTFKLKRGQAKAAHEGLIAAMYESLARGGGGGGAAGGAADGVANGGEAGVGAGGAGSMAGRAGL